jgi:hypothetical protein
MRLGIPQSNRKENVLFIAPLGFGGEEWFIHPTTLDWDFQLYFLCDEDSSLVSTNPSSQEDS